MSDGQARSAAIPRDLEREVEAWKSLSRKWSKRAREAEAELARIREQLGELLDDGE